MKTNEKKLLIALWLTFNPACNPEKCKKDCMKCSLTQNLIKKLELR